MNVNGPPNTTEEIFQHFKGKFPGISDGILYNRVSGSYEGSLCDIWSIKTWEKVLYYKDGASLYTLFKNWEEYIKYNGDYKKHPDYSSDKPHLISY